MTNTLFGRLLVVSLLVLGVLFGALGYATHRAFVENLTNNIQEQLKLQNYVLLTSAKIRNQRIIIEDELREARFEEFESGLYGFITNAKGDILLRTYSANSMDIDPAILKARDPHIGQSEFSVGPKYYRYHHTVSWEVVDDKPQLITFTVLEDRGPAQANISAFERRISLSLVVIALVLIFILLWLLRWGTKPLRQLAVKLKQVESGESDHLEGQYPRELRRLTKNLNQLLATEKRQRERYHFTLSDLAHSLKTPLAVIRSELENGDKNPDVIAEQVERMDEIIKHQLQRAVVTAPHQLGEKVNILETTERLTKALSKVYADRYINFALAMADDIYFQGDKRDLTEVMGNLLDNACKHCHTTVKVDAEIDDSHLIIAIHDDGNGIEDAHKQQLMHRGLRADTRHAGQGIGLDVARDIVNSYRGELRIDDSPLGGALFLVKLPL